MLKYVLPLVFLSLSSTGSLGQDRNEPDPTQLEDIVVEGTPIRDQIETFVDNITAPPPGRGIARWYNRSGICVGVANLRREIAESIADRVSEIAIDLGLPAGSTGCSPNVVIIAADDASAMAGALVKRSPNAFRPFYAGAAQSNRSLELFVSSDRPLRWWHVMMPVSIETGGLAVRLPGEIQTPRIRGGGLLCSSIRNDLQRAYVIVDINQVEHLTIRQLSDYVAMVALAQIDPDADVETYRTILSVVSKSDDVKELTDWDRAYLTGLYGSELRQRNPNAQMGDVAGIMLRDRQGASDGEREFAKPE